MKNKIAQITLFIILGLILFFVVGIGFYFVGNIKGEKSSEIQKTLEVPLEFAPIKNYIESCIERVAVPGIYLLAQKGGYIYSYDRILNTEYVQISYHLEYDNDTSPKKEFMELELSKFISDSLKLCIKNFKDFNYYNLEYGNLEIKVSIKKNNVLIETYYPITIRQENSKITVSNFNKNIPIRLGYILDLKKDIVFKIKGDDLIDLDYLSSHNDIEINILPYDKNNIIYSIFDNSSSLNNVPFFFNFAVKIDGNSAPKLDLIPDFVLTKGKQFVYDINATDPDDDVLSFYTNNGLVSINSTTGLISFKPKYIGEYNTDICVKDKFLATDCKSIKFMVKNV